MTGSIWRFIKGYPFSILLILVVTYLSLMNPPKLNFHLFQGWDKVVHFCMYAGLSGVIWLEYLVKHRKMKIKLLRAIIGPIIVPVLFGGFIELCQHYFTRSRSGDWMDFFANTVGVITASLIAWFFLRPRIIRK
jgi:VanZ family protein